MPARRSLTLEIWADVVCPWCYLGRRRFQRALAAFEQASAVDVVHRAFELDPAAPIGGTEPVAPHLARKYGTSLDQAVANMRQLEDLAREEGLEYDLLRTLRGNTADAHRLLRWASGQRDVDGSPAQDALLEAFYAAYFTRGRSLFDPDSLVALVAEAGLDADGGRAVLAGTQHLDDVRADEQVAAGLGITAVPCFVADRAVAVSGAQPPSVLGHLLRTAWAR